MQEAETPDRVATALSELIQLTSEVLTLDDDRNAEAANFDQTLANKLETLRQTLDESESNSLEEFVLSLTQVRALVRLNFPVLM